MRRIVVLWSIWCAFGGAAHAQGWVDRVISERSFDFGTVARGSKVRHTFKLVNRLDTEVRIADKRTKCGCTEVRIGAYVIPPGTQTVIEAVVDTTKFQGYKASGLTLVLDKPSFAEVDLNVTCFIRGDLTLNPGLVDFGMVPRSSVTKPTVSLMLSYSGGQPNWGITRMQTRGTQVSAKLQEQDRSPGGQVGYLLSATLDPTDALGFFKDEITLFTNDPGSPTIPISVVATVQAAVTVSPAPLVLGQVKAGQVVEKTLLVRSAKPFKVTGVKPSTEDFTTTLDPTIARPVHTLKLAFKAPARTGPYNATLEIASDIEDEPPTKITTFATVVP